ncbi:putative transcription elongation regulator [Sesbania bispinosa]|nr:putative transcription elongation regulator [Sesbania bispinosa]
MVTTKSTTNSAGTGRRRLASVAVATTGPSSSRQKSPPAASVIMAGRIPAVVSVLRAPAVASTAEVSILGGRAPPVVPRPQNQPPPATLLGHLTR